MWKLFDPRSTAARMSGTGWTAGAAAALAGAAGLTPARPVSSGEGGSAPASRRGVGIADHELRTLEAIAVIDLRTRQILNTHGIDQQLHALILDAGIPVLELLVELEPVLKAGTAPALHEHPKHQLGVPFPANEIADLAGGRIREHQGCIGS